MNILVFNPPLIESIKPPFLYELTVLYLETICSFDFKAKRLGIDEVVEI